MKTLKGGCVKTYSQILLRYKELSDFKGHLGLWFGLIPTRTGVQLSQACVFALKTGTEGKQNRVSDTIMLSVFGDEANSQCPERVLTGALPPRSFMSSWYMKLLKICWVLLAGCRRFWTGTPRQGREAPWQRIAQGLFPSTLLCQ